ncbi:Sec-independent protein translocase TatA [Neorhodopirellula lusitana]|uniref:Sec-independent protein translocase TatA n=1 Tax=Neorhodopirellula lusitana TaxID=445327 RepID=A0ABY1PTG6_9BACT|nr:twin-arginine translocase TatA/TatE family subunit [Neorhodopirellula lusitana]SMP42048.1 Sec-independent protein translocase TatA [Neorhodopirellula lusitana]
MFGLSPFELSVIGVIAVVLFGGNLPEVARKFGSTYAQLRRSLTDVQQQFREAQAEASRAMTIEDKSPTTPSYEDEPEEAAEPTAPKFKPPR